MQNCQSIMMLMYRYMYRYNSKIGRYVQVNVVMSGLCWICCTMWKPSIYSVSSYEPYLLLALYSPIFAFTLEIILIPPSVVGTSMWYTNISIGFSYAFNPFIGPVTRVDGLAYITYRITWVVTLAIESTGGTIIALNFYWKNTTIDDM